LYSRKTFNRVAPRMLVSVEVIVTATPSLVEFLVDQLRSGSFPPSQREGFWQIRTRKAGFQLRGGRKAKARREQMLDLSLGASLKPDRGGTAPTHP
jgi:hypothetical protein